MLGKKTTSDEDIEKFEWLPIDIDPVRLSGVSATDEEKQAAIDLAAQINNFLRNELGFSEPVIADSGNGIHIDIPVDLPNNDASRKLTKKALQALDFLFSNDKDKVDLTTYNPARIIKLYGTMACKGNNTQERPHRYSSIISYPAEKENVSAEKLTALAAFLPKDPKPKKMIAKRQHEININDYLAEHNIGVHSKAPWQGGTRWVLSSCPWNSAHTNYSAYIVQFPNGAVAAGCHHNSCSQENWHSLRDKFEPGWQSSGKGNKSEETKDRQSDILLNLAEGIELFHTPADEAYATVIMGNCKRNLRLSDKKFSQWLTHQYYNETGRAPGNDAINQAISVLSAKAIIEGEKQKLYLRVAEHKGNCYYDLADVKGNVVEITPQGFQITANPPKIFRRTNSMCAQVMPDSNGDVQLLKKHIRFKTKADEILFVVTVGTSFVPGIAHPISVTAGEKGAAKTTTMRMQRKLIDPAVSGLSVLPNSEQDLAITLSNNYVASFDNIETISAKQSDMLCMASTGGGFTKRTLYTDGEETILEFKHCVGLNGINVVASRADLLDRSVINELERVPASERREEREVWESFEKDLPAILGGYFNALATAMRIYPQVQLQSLPRMADYCRWGYAIAEAIGYGGEAFIDAYHKNISRANESAINEDPVAAAVIAFMREYEEWEGYIAELLRKLERVAGDEKINIKARRWPKAAHILTTRLKEVKSNLEEVGITFERKHDGGGTRIRLVNTEKVSRKQDRADKLITKVPKTNINDLLDDM